MNIAILWRCTVTLALIIASPGVSAQFKVGDNPTDIHPAAALQVESASQGVLLPRIADTTIAPLGLSPDGMIIYFTDAANSGLNSGLYVRRNSAWSRMEAAGSGWLLTGNDGVTSGNSIGTLNDYPLHFTVNGGRAGYISSDGGSHYRNTSIGYRSLPTTATGFDNAAFGIYALSAVTTGERNTGTGSHALYRNNTGSDNTAVGNHALYENTGSGNTAVGSSAMEDNTSGMRNIAVGENALRSNTTGNYNVALGVSALTGNASGAGNVSVGRGTLEANETGSDNTALGDRALTGNVSGVQNVAVGVSALSNNSTGNNNVAVGPYAMYTTTGASYSNVAVGSYALYNNTTGNNNISVGVRSASGNTTGGANVAIGDSALAVNQTGSYNIAIGRQAGVTSSNLSKAVAIGYNAQVARTNAMVLGDTTDNLFNVGIGRSTPEAKLHVRATAGNNPLILEGAPSGAGSDSILTINPATGVVGKRTVNSLISGGWSVTGNSGTDTATNFIGTTDNMPVRIKVKNEYAGIISERNTAIGYQALNSSQSEGLNTAVGIEAMKNNTGGAWNAVLGYQAMINNTTGNYNVAVGALTLTGNQVGAENTALGHQAASVTTGSRNTAIGKGALASNTTGNDNTAIGANANVTANNLTNATAIGANARVNRSNTVVLGDTSMNNLYVGIGRGAPQARLHIRGAVGHNPLILEGTPTAGAADSILTINTTTGVVGKSPVNTLISGVGWSLMGNAGTDPAVNFIGTTDAMPLKFKVDSTLAGLLSMNNTSFGYGALLANTSGVGNVGVGTTALMWNTTGENNLSIGTNSMVFNTTGSGNIAVGYQALDNNTTGSYNVSIGYQAKNLADTLTNTVGIGARVRVGRSNSIVLGDTTVNEMNVGIGRARPQAKLHVRAASGHNPLILEGMPSGAAADSILTINAATGIVGKRTMSSVLSGGAWTLTGNTGVTNAHFIGTDGEAIRFKISNTHVGIITPAGFPVGMNTVSLGYGSYNAAAGGNITAIGAYALNKQSNFGVYSTAVGHSALRELISGDGNTALGYEAGKGATNAGTGHSNLFAGYQAGYSFTSGSSNTALGARSLYANTTGSFNVSVGDSALYANTTANGNTALGAQALRSNSTGVTNTAVGMKALYSNTGGASNVAVGINALFSNTGGAGNVAVGPVALQDNNGDDNVAIGNQSNWKNTSGGGNASVGSYSLHTNTTGGYNTAMGMYSLKNNVSGAYNTAVGYEAGVTSGAYSNTTAIGYDAQVQNNYATAVGSGTRSANYAISVGFNAKAEYQYGIAVGNGTDARNFAVAVGVSAKAQGDNAVAVGPHANANFSNSVAIGYGAVANATNKVRIGNSNTTVIEGQVAWTFPSDARFKDKVTANVPGLALITRLKPVTYHFDSRRQEEHTTGKPVADNATYQESYKQLHTGFLAQDVEAVCKELGFDFDAVHKPVNERDHYGLAYSQFIMPLVKAVQEQQEIIEQQQHENITLKQQLEAQQKTLDAILKRLEQLERP